MWIYDSHAIQEDLLSVVFTILLYSESPGDLKQGLEVASLAEKWQNIRLFFKYHYKTFTCRSQVNPFVLFTNDFWIKAICFNLPGNVFPEDFRGPANIFVQCSQSEGYLMEILEILFFGIINEQYWYLYLVEFQHLLHYCVIFRYEKTLFKGSNDS